MTHPRPWLVAVLATTLALPGPALAAKIRPDLPSKDARWSSGTATTADVPDAWWQTFDDAALNALVEESIGSN